MAIDIEKNDKYESWGSPNGDQPSLEIIREVAKDKDISISELSKLSDVSRQTMYSYFRGDTQPYAYKLYQICKVLNVRMEYIIEKALDRRVEEKDVECEDDVVAVYEELKK